MRSKWQQSFKKYAQAAIVVVLCFVTMTSCVRRGYQDSEWSTFELSAQQWLDKARLQQGAEAFTFPLPSTLSYQQHGRTKDKAHFGFKHFESANSSNPAAPHIGISGVVQGDKLGMLVFYSTRAKDSEINAPDTIQNIYALAHSLLPTGTDEALIRSTVTELLQQAKQSTFLTSQRNIGDVNLSAKYGPMKLENTELEQDESIDSVVVSICRGEDCK